MAQSPSATPTSIVGSKQPAMKAAPKPQLVSLQCNEAFSHMWGEPTQTSAGQAHIAADGTLLEPPAIAAALLEARVPIDGKETPIYTVTDPGGLQLVKDFLTQKLSTTQEGEDLGRLVYIECQSLAGQPTTVDNIEVRFDASGLAVVGERIYQKMRPAYGGDGAIPDSQNPAHLLFFKGAISSADATSEELEAAFSPDLKATLDGALDGSVQGETVQDETVQDDDDLEDGDSEDDSPEDESPEAALQLGVEVEDTDLAPPAEQLTPAAKALADFNAAPPLLPSSTPPLSAPVEPDQPSEDTAPSFAERLGRVIGHNRVQVLAANQLADEAALRAADKKTLLDLNGIGEPTVVKIQEFLKSHPASAA